MRILPSGVLSLTLFASFEPVILVTTDIVIAAFVRLFSFCFFPSKIQHCSPILGENSARITGIAEKSRSQKPGTVMHFKEKTVHRHSYVKASP